MSMLFGWLTADEGSIESTTRGMLSALRANPAQPGMTCCLPGLGMGVLESPLLDPAHPLESVASPDGRFHLWFAGEAFSWRLPTWEGEGAARSRSPAFRRELLVQLLEHGMGVLRGLDGEYFLAMWDSLERRLTLANDRLGGLPHYWASTPGGFAFAGGVRGVLMAPGVSAEPDLVAIREAITFGGYRLRDRTNVASTRMLPGGAWWEVSSRDGFRPLQRRYWTWSDLPLAEARPALPDAAAQLSSLWERSIRLRLEGARRPGQTLSGGLDSRAILAEAAPRAPRWTAVTYGLAGCDDARIAQQAAAVAGATWVFQPLYAGRDPEWLEARSSRIQETDGLIELSDLMHLESLDLQSRLLDVTLPGYIGDAVIGPTFAHVHTSEDVLRALPHYGVPVGLTEAEIRTIAEDLIRGVEPAPPRFAVFENKLPQSTNRWSAAYRPWVVVRKPFVDPALFDFCMGLSPQVRVEGRLYQHWLLQRYPGYFARIPHQKTGVPILAPPWRFELARGQRFATRKVSSALARLGLPGPPVRRRLYHDNEETWSKAPVRRRIEETVLRPGSVSCEALGKSSVEQLLQAWFDRQQAPAQTIAALYVYEAYHRDLGSFLRSRR